MGCYEVLFLACYLFKFRYPYWKVDIKMHNKKKMYKEMSACHIFFVKILFLCFRIFISFLSRVRNFSHPWQNNEVDRTSRAKMIRLYDVYRLHPRETAF